MGIKRVIKHGGFEEYVFTKPVSAEELDEFFARENGVEIKIEEAENNPEASVESEGIEDDLVALRRYEDQYRLENPDSTKEKDTEENNY